MVWNDLVLPIAYHSVSFGLLSQVILILNIHSRIILEIAHREFVHFLRKEFLPVLCIQGLVDAHFLLMLGLLAENELFNTVLSHLILHICCWFDLEIASQWCQITKSHILLTVSLARMRWLFQVGMNLYDTTRILLLKHQPIVTGISLQTHLMLPRNFWSGTRIFTGLEHLFRDPFVHFMGWARLRSSGSLLCS